MVWINKTNLSFEKNKLLDCHKRSYWRRRLRVQWVEDQSKVKKKLAPSRREAPSQELILYLETV